MMQTVICRSSDKAEAVIPTRGAELWTLSALSPDGTFG
jgi:hypothetical protein